MTVSVNCVKIHKSTCKIRVKVINTQRKKVNKRHELVVRQIMQVSTYVRTYLRRVDVSFLHATYRDNTQTTYLVVIYIHTYILKLTRP